MEPEIIDYYRSVPSCFLTIERLNEEFFELQEKYNLLILNTQTPIIIYKKNEWKKIKSIIKIQIIEKLREFVIINYSRMEVSGITSVPPNSKFLLIIKNILNLIFDINKDKYQKKIKDYAENITHSVYIFLESIINSNSTVRYNIYELSDTIIDIVSKMIEDLVEDIVRFRCSKCLNIHKVLIEDKCINCKNKTK